MAIQLSQVQVARAQSIGSVFSARSLRLEKERSSPVMVADDFRVTGRPFGPHPHAGFSAISYIFEDSTGKLRNRDSLGHELIIGPGGVCWLQAGSGGMHEEIPAENGKELHGLQVFVNLSAKNKFTPPKAMWLEPQKVPEWRSGAGDRVRVAVGSFGGVVSPLEPIEPFDLLDVELKHELTFSLKSGRNAVVFAQKGELVVRSGSEKRNVGAGQGLVMSGEGEAAFATTGGARFMLLSGVETKEPVVMQGPFIMNVRGEIQAAYQRFEAGLMGHLEPYEGN